MTTDLKNAADATTLWSIQDSVENSIHVEVKPPQKVVEKKKRWVRLINARTAAKLGELILKAFLDELYPKSSDISD